MSKKLYFVWLALLISLTWSCSDESNESTEKRGKRDFAELYETGECSIEAGFEPDNSQIILGQPLFITFKVTNRSEKQYRFFVGGDNRGSVRHNNFHITAVNAYGDTVKDPYSYRNFGGKGNNVVLKFGESYSERLFLGHWCAFEDTGTYTVACSRKLIDIGEEPRHKDVPVTSSFDLTIAPYDEKRMRKVIAEWGKKIQYGNEDELYEASLALASICDEQVIPHLARSLSRGDFRNQNPAIQGLAQFPSNEAADALLAALKVPDYMVRDKGGEALKKIGKIDYALHALLSDIQIQSDSVRALTARALGPTKARGALDALLEATNDPEPSVRSAAAEALGTLGYEEAIPRLIELTQSDDRSVIRVASQALGKYDTRESTAALIALTKHDDPEIRKRAGYDVCRSRRPEVKEALKAMLYDEDPRVRADAPRRFINWFRRGEADDVLPRLMEMLDDPVPEVRYTATTALSNSSNTEVVPVLIAELEKTPEDENIKSVILSALYRHYSSGNAGAREMIEERFQLIIHILKDGDSNDPLGNSSQALRILESSDKPEANQAIEWAAESHPNNETRAYAKRCLAKR
jgi:HEAT repeat protein